MTVKVRIDGIVQGALRGWAWDSSQPERRLELAIWVDGEPAGAQVADRHRGDLERAKVGDGAHGFECVFPIERQDGEEHLVELRLADSPMTAPLARAALTVPKRSHMLQGKLERLAGTQLVGWVRDRARPGEAVVLDLLVGELPGLKVQANRFRRDLLAAGLGHGSYGFVFDLAALPEQPAPGTKLTVRAGPAQEYWEVGSLPFVVSAPAPTAVTPPRPVAPRPVAPRPAAPRPAPRRPTAPRGRPHQADTLLEDAKAAERQRDFALAARRLDTALALAPGDFELRFLRARVALALADTATAERFALLALESRPGHANPTRILARLASQAGRHAEAVTLWAAIGPTDDLYRERLVKRGRSLMALGRPLDAMQEFGQAVALAETDRDGLRGLAEATEAAGGLHAALGHWRRFAELAPEDASAGEHVAQLTARARPRRASTGPLLDASLRDWRGQLEGEVGRHGMTPTPALRLRSLDPGGAALRYAVVEPREDRPGELPGYGLLLAPMGEAAEASFTLDPAAAALLTRGIRLVQEGRALDASAPALEVLLTGGGEARLLCRYSFGPQPRLVPFDLRLDAAEAAALVEAGLVLTLRLGGPGALVLRAPRFYAALPVPVLSAPAFEDSALGAARFAALATR